MPTEPTTSRGNSPRRFCCSVWPLFLALLMGVGVAITLVNGHPQRAMVAKWGDHVSNLYSTLLFWREGHRLYSRPTGELLGRQQWSTSGASGSTADLLPWPPETVFADSALIEGPIYIVSPHLPRHYPPGLYLILTPLALAWRQGWVENSTALSLVLLLYLGFALAGGVLLGRLAGGHWGGWAFAGLATVELVRWSLNGMYDAIGVVCLLVMLLKFGRRHWAQVCFWYGLALFVHFRSLWLFPVGLWALVELWRQRGAAGVWRNPWIMAGLALALVSVGSFVLAMPGLKDLPLNNSLYLGAGPDAEIAWLRVALLVIASVGLAFGLARASTSLWARAGLVATVLWPLLMWLATPLIQQWYVLFLIPLAWVPRLVSATSLETSDSRLLQRVFLASAGWVLVVAILLMRNSPFEFRFFREATAVLVSTLQ